ncbi:MAG: YggT family protein [Thermodesulfobacteriota bacterium]|nr:YggT family protein [Thermodesulfobacteriota bacterium]
MVAPENNLLNILASLLSYGLTLYMWVVIVRAVISWVNPNPHNPVVRFLAKVTDPVLYHVRRILPVSYSGIDFSPIILILLIIFFNDFAVRSLKAIALGMPSSVVLPFFVISVIRLVQGVLFAFMIVIIARAVISWISPDPYNPIVRFIYGVTEPLLSRLRRMLPLVVGGVDLTPIVVIALIYFINMFLDRAMLHFGQAFI